MAGDTPIAFSTHLDALGEKDTWTVAWNLAASNAAILAELTLKRKFCSVICGQAQDRKPRQRGQVHI
jgi:hypothetical protein